MNGAATLPVETPRRIRLDWIPAVLFTPRQILPKIVAQQEGNWLTPMLLLTLFVLVGVLVAGPIKQADIANNGLSLPPGFEQYPPEQQAQYMQAAQAQQSPVFIYVFPGLIALGEIWLGWLIVGGVLHLSLTLLGGRGGTGSTMNLVAWAALPFAIREGVRIFAMLLTNKLIANPGLAGFAPAGAGNLDIFLSKLLALIDIYIIWHIMLLVLGAHAAGLKTTKAVIGVAVAMVIILCLQAALGLGASLLSGLSPSTPFFF